jgi:small subunit ribosomal protein S20
MRQSEKRRVRNAGIRSGVRTAVKGVRSAIESGSVDEARVQWSRTVKVLDKAATKGVVHKNAVARRKSRLTRQLNALVSR